MKYLDVESARSRRDLRLVLTQGVPGPWGEAAKGLFRVKRIPYTAVAQQGGGENAALREWTGHANAPIVVCEDEPPRSAWSEILFFVERRAPDPPLIPRDPRNRALMFGLSHELCGEDGFGWNRRLMMVHQALSAPASSESPVGVAMRRLGARYGYSPSAATAAPQRCAEILQLLASQLHRQRERDRHFFVGASLSALDVYWAAFAALASPLPAALCPMPDFLRPLYQATSPLVTAALDPILIEHRDGIYEEFLELPLDF